MFIFGPETQGDTPEKLDRNAKVKVFDYQKFRGQMQRYVKENRTKLPEVFYTSNNFSLADKSCTQIERHK